MRRAAQIGLAAGATAAIVGTQEWMARRYYARTRGPQTFVEQEEQTAWTAVWHELLAPAAVARLAASPVYQGHDVPRGNGEPVVLVHGFLMRGYYLRPMERWFRRLGYDARTAPIYAHALVGMVAFVGQWWTESRKPPPPETVASHVAALAWMGLRHLPRRPAVLRRSPGRSS